jgi:molybdopterin-guanine dinucleotide biosynthesis protein A
MKVDAVLPAGGRISSEFAEQVGGDVKALISFGGRTILERTLAALRATEDIGRVIVVGPREIKERAGQLAADAVLPEAGSGPANILRGLDWLREANGGRCSRRVLILTTDLPFLTPEAVAGFLDACPRDLDFCLPVLRREEFEACFPHHWAHYVRLRDGEWKIGCGALVSPAAITRNRHLIERVFGARKSHLAMARLLGPLFILRFLTGRLTVRHIEHRSLRILGCSGTSIHGCAPELAFDIDYPRDYRYAVHRFA